MKKFSSLNESVSIDKDKVVSLLSKIDNISYQIFDYYTLKRKYNSGAEYIEFIDDFSNITENSKNAKIILINFKNKLDRVNIEEWDSKLKFNSSGFAFIDNIDIFLESMQQISSLLKQLKEYSPKLCLKDHKCIIYLIGDTVSEGDIKTKKDIIESYKILYEKLEKRTDLFKSVTFFSEFNNLSVKFKDDNERKIELVLASLCSQLSSKEGFTWMKDIDVDVELENVKDTINELGFNIVFSSQSSSRDGLTYNLTIVEI